MGSQKKRGRGFRHKTGGGKGVGEGEEKKNMTCLWRKKEEEGTNQVAVVVLVLRFL